MDLRHVITGAWFNGRFGGMADPKTYPSLTEVLEQVFADPVEAAGDDELDPEAEHVGAKLWIMYLNRGKQ